MNPINQKGAKYLLKYQGWLWLLFVAVVIYFCQWVWNPLPSDEKMIRNFKEHRADFVEVVRRYREYPRLPKKSSAFWYKEGDTLELFKRAKIDSVSFDARTPWLPSPYSLETAINMEKERKAAGPFELFYKYGALRIRPATTPRIDHPDQSDDHSYRRNTLFFGVIWKDYYFFPEIPRIENRELLGPLSTVGNGFPGSHQYHEKEDVSTFQYRVRVLPSLNYLPSHWKSFECVYRQIEPQWFIRMCNGH